MVVEADPALVLAPLENAGQRGKIDFAFAEVVIAEKKRRVPGACFVHHTVGEFDIFPGESIAALPQPCTTMRPNRAPQIIFPCFCEHKAG